MKQPATNEQILKKLLRELHPIEVALLRERIETITDITLNDLKDPVKRLKYSRASMGMVSAEQWEETMERIKKIVKTRD